MAVGKCKEGDSVEGPVLLTGVNFFKVKDGHAEKVNEEKEEDVHKMQLPEPVETKEKMKEEKVANAFLPHEDKDVLVVDVDADDKDFTKPGKKKKND